MKTLRFDARLYVRSAVDRAAADFAEAADLSVREASGVITVEIGALKGDVEAAELEGEFGNYVLGLMQS